MTERWRRLLRKRLRQRRQLAAPSSESPKQGRRSSSVDLTGQEESRAGAVLPSRGQRSVAD